MACDGLLDKRDPDNAAHVGAQCGNQETEPDELVVDADVARAEVDRRVLPASEEGADRNGCVLAQQLDDKKPCGVWPPTSVRHLTRLVP